MNVELIFFVMSVVVVSHEQSLTKMRSDWKKVTAPYLTRCLCETKVNPDLVEAFFEFGEVTDDPCFKCTVKCMAQAAGILSITGNVNRTRYRSLYGVTDEVISKCANNTHVDLCQRALEIFSCGYTLTAARVAANSNNINSKMILPSSSTKMWNAFPQFVLQNP